MTETLTRAAEVSLGVGRPAIQRPRRCQPTHATGRRVLLEVRSTTIRGWVTWRDKAEADWQVTVIVATPATPDTVTRDRTEPSRRRRLHRLSRDVAVHPCRQSSVRRHRKHRDPSQGVVRATARSSPAGWVPSGRGPRSTGWAVLPNTQSSSYKVRQSEEIDMPTEWPSDDGGPFTLVEERPRPLQGIPRRQAVASRWARDLPTRPHRMASPLRAMAVRRHNAGAPTRPAARPRDHDSWHDTVQGEGDDAQFRRYINWAEVWAQLGRQVVYAASSKRGSPAVSGAHGTEIDPPP